MKPRDPCVVVRNERCSKAGVVWIGWEGYLCEEHAHAIWRHVEQRDSDACDQQIPGAERREQMRVAFRKKRATEKRKPVAMGQIYFVQVDGLIKVGWTSVLSERIRAYGPKAILLANYPGTRADETALHKQLTPARYRGREWYSDCSVTRLFIDEALDKYGPPRFVAIGWTQPRQIVAGKRHH